MTRKIKIKLPTVVMAVICVAGILSHTAQAAINRRTQTQTMRAAVTFLKAVPPRASLVQIKKLLPDGTWYQNAESTTVGDWTYNAVKFGGRLSGVLVFANTRRAGLPQSEGQNETIGWLKPDDPIHYIEVFLGSAYTRDNSFLRTDTKRYISQLKRHLGQPTRQQWTGDNEGVGEDGWMAQWQRRGRNGSGREVSFSMTIPFRHSDTRPVLGLQFPYSHLYRS